MFNSTAMEIGIGLIVTYLGISLVCTAANELLAALTRARALELERGIRNLLDGTSQVPERWWEIAGRRFIGGRAPKAGAWSDALFEHQLINGLSKDDEKPSYIPAQLFARSLLQVILQKAANEARCKGAPTPAPLTGNTTFEQIRQMLELLPADDRILQALVPLLDEASTDLTDGITAAKKFIDQIETWYDHAMDRVSGWYKRRTQGVLMLIAILFVVTMNVDTVAIGRALGRNDALRQSMVAAAQHVVQHLETRAATTQPSFPDAMTAVQDRVNRLNQLGIPLGWNRWDDAHPKDSAYAPRDDNLYDVTHDEGLFLTKLFGLLVTAFAASLGAPFWFDALNRIMSVRATGKAPEERPKDPKVVLQPQSPKQTP